jgi:hypothetical protein
MDTKSRTFGFAACFADKHPVNRKIMILMKHLLARQRNLEFWTSSGRVMNRGFNYSAGVLVLPSGSADAIDRVIHE